MEERDNLICLFDYYGKLLTDKQQELFNDYYFDNLTMEEISINNKVSKNAISKQLISIKNKLYSFENVLKLYENYNTISKLLDKDTLNKIEKYI